MCSRPRWAPRKRLGSRPGTKGPFEVRFRQSGQVDQEGSQHQDNRCQGAAVPGEFRSRCADLAKQYEDAGNLVKTRKMLELILKLSPEVKGVRAKIKQIDEEMLSANGLTAEVNTARGWGPPVAAVFKGQAFRIRAVGDYRFVTNLSIGPSGFAVADASRDMAADIRCGALIGVVVPPPEAGKQPEPGKPFLVGAGGTITPAIPVCCS
ncbi:MAG: hypothetical protein Ct9H300mP1_09040 [Planctomycetaceae bacterium]|nr:MAG: hypothetical protein Ct9H300mP1_09040 [Planctomycetaceae bacterium]